MSKKTMAMDCPAEREELALVEAEVGIDPLSDEEFKQITDSLIAQIQRKKETAAVIHGHRRGLVVVSRAAAVVLLCGCGALLWIRKQNPSTLASSSHYPETPSNADSEKGETASLHYMVRHNDFISGKARGVEDRRYEEDVQTQQITYSAENQHDEYKPRQQFVEVQRGDTLSKIAKRELGSAELWKKIWDANRCVITDPNHIKPGQKVKIPRNQNG